MAPISEPQRPGGPFAQALEEEAGRLASWLSASFRREPLLVCPIREGGAWEFAALIRTARRLRFSLPPLALRPIRSELRWARGELRRILTRPDAVRVRGTRDLLIYDDSIKTGRSMLGAIAWALFNHPRLRFRRLYIAASYDFLGLAHFVLHPGPAHLGVRRLLHADGQSLRRRFPLALEEISAGIAFIAACRCCPACLR